MVEEEAYEPGEDNFWTIELEQQRCLERDNARTNIKIEQTKQNRSYVMKVEINRFLFFNGNALTFRVIYTSNFQSLRLRKLRSKLVLAL